MDRPQDADLLAHLGRLVNGELPPAAFRQWFANALWEIEGSADDDTLEFAYLIENRLAEWSGGHIGASELLTVLRRDIERRSERVANASNPRRNVFAIEHGRIPGLPAQLPARSSGRIFRFRLDSQSDSGVDVIQSGSLGGMTTHHLVA